MPWNLKSGDARRSDHGSALVIVLFFVILLTGLTIAFLSRSLTASKVSASSTGENKVSLLVNSAGDIVIGDLKQEIVAGSTTATGSTVNWPIYSPNANATMIPFLNGTPASSATIPNLISRSVSPSNTGGTNPYVAYSTTLYTAASVPPNRAAVEASANTTTYSTSKVNTSYPSLNGRFISAAQWNSHYLVPRDPAVNAAGSLSTDGTPISSFVPPDWIVVTRGGANSVSWNATLSDPTLSNTNYAVGRYAYAVYNEGGLLDMNVAGYPNDPTTPGNSGGLTLAQASGKGSMALADLTQLNVGGALSQTKINNLVGWRNYATSQLSAVNGTYGGFTFTTATSSNWLNNFVLNNTNGFMKTIAPTGVTTPPSDQAFLSRQQLITLAQSLAISPDFLQYMGTFSRSMEQPSFVPDPNRPLIINGAIPPPAQTLVDSYAGNNDYVNKDNTTINVPLLAQRVTGVTAGLNRNDGSSFTIGEPLLKKKFPLSRLSYVTYSSTATAVATDKIYANFGITRATATVPWVYNHGSATAILTLSQVKVAKREPDMAELLKAAIVAGSMGKGGPNLHNGNGNFQYLTDTTTDLQVLQIMANLIDQADTDSYPTVIQLKNATLGYATVYGVEDLPYFYRYHLFGVVDQLPQPAAAIISKSSSVTFPVPSGTETVTTKFASQTYTSGVSSSTITRTANNPYQVVCTSCAKNATTITNQGEATFMYVIDLWNPHDPNNVATSVTKRPVKFRVYAETWDPYSTATPPLITNSWKLGTECLFGDQGDVTPNPSHLPTPIAGQSSFNFIIPENNSTEGNASPVNPPTSYNYPISATVAYTTPVATNTLTFTDATGALFREPTLLWNATDPTGSTISGSSVTDANTGQKYYGIIAGKAKISQQFTISSSPANLAIDGTYIAQATSIGLLSSLGTSPSYPQITFFLQYQDPNDASGNTWTTYDEKYPDLHGMSNPSLVVNTADYASGNWQNPLANSQFSGSAACMDPRTARWGVGTATTLGNLPGGSAVPYVLEPTMRGYITANNYTSMKGKYFSSIESNRPRADAGNVVYYSNPCMTSDPPAPSGLRNLQMRWFGQGEYRAGSTAATGSPNDYDGMFSQNNPAIQNTILSQNGTTTQQLFNEDPDGVARRASGSYADITASDSNTSDLAAPSTIRTGMPMATASTISDTGVATATSQSQSRPLVLNRPFRSVAEMSYAFRGSPWKNIDFENPESGDAALLDTFCVNELPSNGIVAGKVDLNTRNTPVLQAIVAGAYQDEIRNAAASPPAYSLSPLSGTEASKVATTLTGITSDTTHAWRGPLQNVSALVGRYVATPGATTGYTDFYTYTPASPVSGQTISATYSGLSAALDCSAINGAANHVYTSSSSPVIQRFRESAIRPLADAGQVRVWNLLIDLVVQTGKYPKTATGFDQFLVDGQKRVWLHVAIDRLTGQVLDKQVEVVTP